MLGFNSTCEITAAVFPTYRERRNLALALKDTRSVVGTLTYVLGAILQAVFFFFYLLVLRVSTRILNFGIFIS